MRLRNRLMVPLFAAAVIATAVVAEVRHADPVDAQSTSSYQPTATTAAAKTSTTAKVTKAANAFLKTLSSTQRDTVLYSFNDSAKTTGWSNLPVGAVTRNGLQISQMSTVQLQALRKLLQASLSSQGYAQEEAIRKADSYLQSLIDSGQGKSPGAGGGGTPPADGTAPTGTPPTGTAPTGTAPTGTAPTTTTSTSTGAQYGETLYSIAFFGTPSTTKKWMLQFGGHHLAVNETFSGSEITGTPYFVGVEPLSFVVASKSYAPLKPASDAMVALFGSLTTDELAAAKLTKTYDDVLLGPGSDDDFPATKEGVAVSSLSDSQKALLTKAIEQWVGNVPNAKKLMAAYEKGYADTKIAYATSTDPTVQGSYFRIDGPRVWIEIVSQAGVVTSNIHYHSVWRDRGYDYGG
jgi:hypothetical protein